jgi:nicotinate-nucleotide adenylyltransferase
MEIALFGGSFDPPHVGHLLAATYVLATEPVGELWLVPVNQHPFGKKLAAPFEHRAELCEAMIAGAGLGRARVCRVEAEMGGEVRTVDLLEHLKASHPEHSFALVVGSDLAAERASWKRFDRVAELARIVELRRGGFEGGTGAVLPEVSSTEVRALLASGKDASRLVPREVLRRIRGAGSYLGSPR